MVLSILEHRRFKVCQPYRARSGATADPIPGGNKIVRHEPAAAV